MARPFKVWRLQRISFKSCIFLNHFKEGDISQGKKPSLKKNATPLLSTLGAFIFNPIKAGGSESMYRPKHCTWLDLLKLGEKKVEKIALVIKKF